jgi:hypothetical protein
VFIVKTYLITGSIKNCQRRFVEQFGGKQAPKVTTIYIFFVRDPIYLQSVIIHSANGGKVEGWHVEEHSVALLC